MKLTLPTDSAERKRYPIRKGCLNYFPAAIAGVAKVSIDGNDKHNPGQPLHHARGKSSDHADCIDRHLTDVEDILAYVERSGPDHVAIGSLLTEANQLAWRALALSQELHEKYAGAPLAPAAKLANVADNGSNSGCVFFNSDIPVVGNLMPGKVTYAPENIVISGGRWDGDRSEERIARAAKDYKLGQVFP